MGECLISRRGGEAYKLPILDTNYPQDITVMATPNGTASFSIAIAEHGKPTNYTYQWYVNGEAVSGATNANYVKSTTANDVGTYTVYCDITNKAGTISSRIATLVVNSAMPFYSYNGNATLQKDGDYAWTLLLKSSGNLVLEDNLNVDICLVGGGGGGYTVTGLNGGGGGAGGYMTTRYAQTIASGSHSIQVGAGGSPKNSGGTTSAFGLSAGGGSAGNSTNGGTSGTGAGGNGGFWNGGNNTGEGGSNGSNGKQAFGIGSIYYGAGGGGGGCKYSYPNGAGGQTGGGNGGSGNATPNTGSGGGGAKAKDGGGEVVAGSGGSGIVIIRSAR